MRWEYKPKPKSSWRIILRFACTPVLTTLPIKQYIWLEFYKINQQFVDGYWIDQQVAPKEYWS